MDRQYLLTKHAFDKHLGYKSEVKREIYEVQWHEDPIECGFYPAGVCAGVASLDGKGWRVDLKVAECVPASSWTHELIHIFAHETWGDADSGHTNPDLWGNDDSVERRAQAAGRYEGMCD